MFYRAFFLSALIVGIGIPILIAWLVWSVPLPSIEEDMQKNTYSPTIINSSNKKSHSMNRTTMNLVDSDHRDSLPLQHIMLNEKSGNGIQTEMRTVKEGKINLSGKNETVVLQKKKEKGRDDLALQWIAAISSSASPDWETQGHVMKQIIQGGTETVQVLNRLFQMSERPDITKMAAQALIEMGDEKGLAVLLRSMILNGEFTKEDRMVLLALKSSISQPVVRQNLCKALDNFQGEERTQMLRLLAYSGGTEETKVVINELWNLPHDTRIGLIQDLRDYFNPVAIVEIFRESNRPMGNTRQDMLDWYQLLIDIGCVPLMGNNSTSSANPGEKGESLQQFLDALYEKIG